MVWRQGGIIIIYKTKDEVSKQLRETSSRLRYLNDDFRWDTVSQQLIQPGSNFKQARNKADLIFNYEQFAAVDLDCYVCLASPTAEESAG